MTVLLSRIHVASLRLSGVVRPHWRRIAVGALCGWILSTVFGAFALVGLESLDAISDRTAPLLAAGLVWGGAALGAVVAYAARPQPQPPSRRRDPRR